MNRKQRRVSKHQKSPYAAAQAQFESELRRALREHEVQLITASTGFDDAGAPTWVLQVKRDVQTWLLRAPNRAVPHMVKLILARMNGETDEIEAAQKAVMSDVQPASASASAPPVSDIPHEMMTAPMLPTEVLHPPLEQVVTHTEDLSHYLDEALKVTP